MTADPVLLNISNNSRRTTDINDSVSTQDPVGGHEDGCGLTALRLLPKTRKGRHACFVVDHMRDNVNWSPSIKSKHSRRRQRQGERFSALSHLAPGSSPVQSRARACLNRHQSQHALSLPRPACPRAIHLVLQFHSRCPRGYPVAELPRLLARFSGPPSSRTLGRAGASRPNLLGAVRDVPTVKSTASRPTEQEPGSRMRYSVGPRHLSSVMGLLQPGRREPLAILRAFG